MGERHGAEAARILPERVTDALAVGAGLALRGVVKTFPGTLALDEVSLTARRGEVLALLGHNGSGKSTLIKILAGFHQPDSGEASVDREPLELGSGDAATKQGLRFVHQELGLVLEQNAVDNVGLTIGYSRSRIGRIDQREQVRRTSEMLSWFGVKLDVRRPLTEATAVERTCVAIARAMWDYEQGPRVLILDEPTAALSSREVEKLFGVLREIRAAGHAVIYVSHRMDEIFEVADHVVVLRSGHVVADGPVAEQTPRRLAELIAGHGLTDQQAAVPRAGGNAEQVLEIRGLRSAALDGVDIDLRRGEVLGIAGLVGSGADELPYVLSGAVSSTSDSVWRLGGRDVKVASPSHALGLGLAFLPAERAREGLIAEFTVAENVTLAGLGMIAPAGMMTRRAEHAAAEPMLVKVGVPVETARRPIGSLSGGNQQRILLARCLFSEPEILVMAEPTAGVDVGARDALYALFKSRVREGLSIIISSSDVEDLTTLCDRVLVLRAGRVTSEMSGAQIEAARIVEHTEMTL
jgi:ABC-type sugar transport system ATPase subunit